MNCFVLDASALCKRYLAEVGSDSVDLLLDAAGTTQLSALRLNVGEVVSALVRRRNAGVITEDELVEAMDDLTEEVVRNPAFQLLVPAVRQIDASWDLIEQYSINSTDALLLRCALDMARALRADGDDLVLVASDQRLISAARAEGLLSFDPQVDGQTQLEALLGATDDGGVSASP